MNESDPRSDMHYLGSSESKAWKKKKNIWLSYILNHKLLCDRVETNNDVDNSVKHKPIIVKGPTNM